MSDEREVEEQFPERLAASMKRHKNVLDRLAVAEWKESGVQGKPCSNGECSLNYAHSGPCADVRF